MQLADVLYELDRADEAEAQLVALRTERPASPAPYHMAGELMEEREAYQEALTWFNMAVSRVSDEELAELRSELGFLSHVAGIVQGRRRVREALGLPPDELDESAPVPDAGAFDGEDLAERLADGARPPRQVRVLFWPRDEVPLAHQRWPVLVEHGEADSVTIDREIANRELSEAGVAQIVMVPLTVARLIEFAANTGGDPEDEDTRRDCMDEIIAEGGVIAWPPGRNEPCWCGSRVKYKKCCGRPNLA
ncbi:SEC-C domain-containing protein [Solihabitans fulvus]|uniref:SEC-C domain-containing protein n=1 Tax=Solihabitans fulvus TaxID=1892852 RepID=A0A5B2XAW4_9PSEU|nr:SEC-C domain-containing protein [Solihabitans fulvus]